MKRCAMKRVVGLGALAMIAALAACNQTPPPPAAENLLFPALGAAPYAADYAMNAGDQMRTMRIMRSGTQQRVESAGVSEGATMVVLLDGATGKMVQFQTGTGASKIATIMSRDKLGALAGAMDLETAAKARPPKHLGKATVAQTDCEIWELPPPAPETPSTPSATAPAASDEPDATQICVTRDGVLLRVQEAKAVQPQLVATKVERGAQDPALFAVPVDYKVVDMSECMDAGAAMMAAVKAGKKPDMALMAKCQGLMSGQ